VPGFRPLPAGGNPGFTTGGVYGGEAGEEHLSFTQGGGHGGSHPHLAHRFVEMLKTGKDAYPNAIEAPTSPAPASSPTNPP
jgi:hypothetical protein